MSNYKLATYNQVEYLVEEEVHFMIQDARPIRFRDGKFRVPKYAVVYFADSKFNSAYVYDNVNRPHGPSYALYRGKDKGNAKRKPVWLQDIIDIYTSEHPIIINKKVSK